MYVSINIPNDTIANLMTSAIESGDPVTTASRGGWCAGVFYVRENFPEAKLPEGYWYADRPDWYTSAAFQIQVKEVTGERNGATKLHTIRGRHLRAGLTAMAKEAPEAFANVLKGDTDAADADSFLQCVVFGKLVYG